MGVMMRYGDIRSWAAGVFLTALSCTAPAPAQDSPSQAEEPQINREFASELKRALILKPLGNYICHHADPGRKFRGYTNPGITNYGLGQVYHGVCDGDALTASYSNGELLRPPNVLVEYTRHINCRSAEAGYLAHDLVLAVTNGLGPGSPDWDIGFLGDGRTRFILGRSKGMGWHEAVAGWYTSAGETLLVEFRYPQEVAPDWEKDAVIGAYLQKYPSALKKEDWVWEWRPLRRAEAAKALAAGDVARFGLCVFWSFSTRAERRMKDARDWWEKNKERDPEDWRTEGLADSIQELVDVRDVERMIPARLLASLENQIPFANDYFTAEPDQMKRNRREFWQGWWEKNKGKKVTDQWASLFDELVSTLDETQVDRAKGETGRGEISRQLLQVSQLSYLTAEHERELPWMKLSRQGEDAKKQMRGWKEWWAKNKDTYRPALLRRWD
jgi:hypothetical protein